MTGNTLHEHDETTGKSREEEKERLHGKMKDERSLGRLTGKDVKTRHPSYWQTEKNGNRLQENDFDAKSGKNKE